MVPLTDKAWTDFLTEPFHSRFGDLSLVEPLKAALTDRVGPEAAANHGCWLTRMKPAVGRSRS